MFCCGRALRCLIATAQLVHILPNIFYLCAVCHSPSPSSRQPWFLAAQLGCMKVPASPAPTPFMFTFNSSPTPSPRQLSLPQISAMLGCLHVLRM